MALTSTPILTRSTSMPELSDLGYKTLPRNFARSVSLLDVTTPIVGTAEPQNPDGVSSGPSMLETEEPKSITESKSEKRKHSTKKSNKISNDKKAAFHFAAVAGAVTIGAALAPFTLGFSLLPTVFVVMFGNASALAMYGGSQFVVDDQEKKKPEQERKPVTSELTQDKPFPLLSPLPRPKSTKEILLITVSTL